MLKSAFNYLGVGGGGGGGGGGLEGNGNFVSGNVIEMNESISVRVLDLLGTGGFATIYAVQHLETKEHYALKRIIASDKQKQKDILKEISLLKKFSGRNGGIVEYVTCSSSSSTSFPIEYLILMEICTGGPLNCTFTKSGGLFYEGSNPSPQIILTLFTQMVEAVHSLHSDSLPVIHRDIKLENFLIDNQGRLKLCDFGSATTEFLEPNETWTTNQRNLLEDEMALYSTPMYRSPEMVDTWNNYPITTKVDIWALGCILYTLCFHRHPFEDSAKLRIVNGNFTIPENSPQYSLFYDLIGQMLIVDPRLRPDTSMILQHLKNLAKEAGGITATDRQKIDFFPNRPETSENELGSNELDNRENNNIGAVAGSWMSSIKGGAGTFMKNIKESSKAVMDTIHHQVNINRNLDFDCITDRLAVMSYPSDRATEISPPNSNRNYIEDIKNLMESKYPSHYSIVNVTSPDDYKGVTYGPTRFPTGNLMDAKWSSGMISIMTLIDTANNVINYLRQDKENVVVIHDLDGKSNSALLTAAVLMQCNILDTSDEALDFFALKRCPPILSNSQKKLLSNFETLIRQQDLNYINVDPVRIMGVIIEPVPLFSKARDGCRPFIEVHSLNSGEMLHSTSVSGSENNKFVSAAYDEEVKIPMNIVVDGDTSLALFHARTTLGKIQILAKQSGIPICKLYLHPAFLPEYQNHIKFEFKDLDELQSQQVGIYPPNFKVVVNFKRLNATSKTKKIPKPTPYPKGLLFSSYLHMEENDNFMAKNMNLNKTDKKVIVTNIKAPSPTTVPKPPIVQDLIGAAPPAPPSSTIPQSSSDNHLLVDIFGESNNKSNDVNAANVINSKATTPSSDQIKTSFSTNDLFGSSFNSTTPLEQQQQPFSSSTNSTNVDNCDGLLLDIAQPGFDSSTPAAPPPPPSTSSASNIDPFDLFGGGGNIPTLPPMSVPAAATPSKPLDDIDELLKDIKVSHSGGPTQGNLNNNCNRPNYNSAFFKEPKQQTTTTATTPKSSNLLGVNPQSVTGVGLNDDSFSDLLGGFSSERKKKEEQPKTIGAMKKKKQLAEMTPEEAAISQWIDGKERNIRALLCSLHTVIWPDSRWTQCGMHQLVAKTDVKKMYRKACLAVHPDKQTGTNNENLSKLVFMELNDAWSEFESAPI